LVGDKPDTLLIEKDNTMIDELILREDGECRESVPSGEPSESTDPGLTPDLPVSDCSEGPDMPKNDKDKRKVAYQCPLNGDSDLKISESTPVCQGDETEENDRGVTSDAFSVDIAVVEDPVADSKGDSDSNNVPQNMEEEVIGATDVVVDCLLLPVMPSSPAKASSPRLEGEEVPLHSVVSSNEQAHTNVDSNLKEELHESEQDSDVDTDRFSSDSTGIEATDKDESHKVDSNDKGKEPSENETFIFSSATDRTTVSLVENEFPQGKESGSPTAIDSVTPRMPDECRSSVENATDNYASTENTVNLGTSPELEPADPQTMRDKDEETFSSKLLVPMLDHRDGSEEQADTGISLPGDTDSGDELKSLGRLKSDETDETFSDSFDESSDKSVRFADPLVTSSWDVPRIHSDDLEELFYTAMDISKFRQQRQKGNVPPSRPYDKAHCERLVEDLDRFGAESFVAGEYQKALGAFNHSLQVKTQIMTDCDNSSTAITIHCIADCYSKKGKWIQAMDAYNAALLVLEKAADTEEVRTSRIALDQKVQIIRRMLGLQSISES
jgi:hypothetical protein